MNWSIHPDQWVLILNLESPQINTNNTCASLILFSWWCRLHLRRWTVTKCFVTLQPCLSSPSQISSRPITGLGWLLEYVHTYYLRYLYINVLDFIQTVLSSAEQNRVNFAVWKTLLCLWSIICSSCQHINNPSDDQTTWNNPAALKHQCVCNRILNSLFDSCWCVSSSVIRPPITADVRVCVFLV